MTINVKVEYSATATAISYMDDVEQVFHIILLDCQLFCQFLCWWSSEVTIDIVTLMVNNLMPSSVCNVIGHDGYIT